MLLPELKLPGRDPSCEASRGRSCSGVMATLPCHRRAKSYSSRVHNIAGTGTGAAGWGEGGGEEEGRGGAETMKFPRNKGRWQREKTTGREWKVISRLRSINMISIKDIEGGNYLGGETKKEDIEQKKNK